MNTKAQKKDVKKDDSYLLHKDECPFVITEAYRNLMTNISFAIPQKENKNGKIICITSSISGEGKTTVASNLAITFATSGKKTILLDCDLRKHSLLKYFKIKPRHGMTSYLSGMSTFEDVLIKDVVANLDIIGCSKSAPNPIILFNSEKFEDFLRRLEQEYDYVLIDTPPVGVVAEGLNIASRSDGVVVVVKSMLTTHKLLQKTITDLDFAGSNILGFVFKDSVGLNNKSGYYKYKYYYNIEKTSPNSKKKN